LTEQNIKPPTGGFMFWIQHSAGML